VGAFDVETTLRMNEDIDKIVVVATVKRNAECVLHTQTTRSL